VRALQAAVDIVPASVLVMSDGVDVLAQPQQRLVVQRAELPLAVELRRRLGHARRQQVRHRRRLVNAPRRSAVVLRRRVPRRAQAVLHALAPPLDVAEALQRSARAPFVVRVPVAFGRAIAAARRRQLGSERIDVGARFLARAIGGRAARFDGGRERPAVAAADYTVLALGDFRRRKR